MNMNRVAKSLVLLLLSPVIALGVLFSMWQYLFFALVNPQKAWKIALAVDVTSNTAANGRLGQSISSRAAMAQAAGRPWGCFLCKYILDFVNPGHCEKALTDPKQNLGS